MIPSTGRVVVDFSGSSLTIIEDKFIATSTLSTSATFIYEEGRLSIQVIFIMK